MLAGLLTLSNKFNFTLTIDFIIMVTELIMVQKVPPYHRFTDGKLSRVIFIDIMIKLVSLLSPEVANGMVANAEQVIKTTGRLIKYFSIWEVAMRVASSCMTTLSTTFQQSFKTGRLKLALSIQVHISLYFTFISFISFYIWVFTRSVLRSNSVTQSFNDLIQELDSVMDGILKIVKFDKCSIPDGACKISAECVQSINGKKCECNDLDTGIGLKCNCACP